MKSRGRLFLIIWLSCLAAGIVVGFITAVVVQALVPPPEGEEGNMAYGFYVLFWVLGAVNLTNYGVAVYLGTRFVKQQQGEVLDYLWKASVFSGLAFIVTAVICPLAIANSLIAALVVITCTRPSGPRANPSSTSDVAA